MESEESWEDEGGKVLTACAVCGKMVAETFDEMCVFCWLKDRSQNDKLIEYPGAIRRLGGI